MGRGLSADEKRAKLLEIFHETVGLGFVGILTGYGVCLTNAIALQKDFYQLKELEKLGPKMKGIVSQSVKEVLQSLVDDGLVQSDKVGTSNFFWSFPSQRGTMIVAKLNAARRVEETARANISELKNLIEQEKVVRPDTVERKEKLALLASKQHELSDMKSEMAQYGACDPVQIEAKKTGIVLAHEAAIRWTENFSSLRSHFIARTGANWANIQTYLGIGEDFEDIS